MNGSLYRALRPLLFACDSERAHDLTLGALGFVSRRPALLARLRAARAPDRGAPIELFGLRFPNRLGLAAGMDKRAACLPAWDALGFGFCELGGVTFHPQPGNDKPRMFRAAAERALVNRMGFNNPGAVAFAATLREWRARGLWPSHPVGVNLGKSKITPLERAAQDYADSFALLRDLADFFVVNVSSPNTPNLRTLQDRSALDEILRAIAERDAAPRKPLLVKVAPDLSFDALDEILELAEQHRLAGIVATNTTIARPEPASDEGRRVYAETGGLSGAPLRERSTAVIAHLAARSGGRIPIVGVGGIFTGDDAREKLDAGASLLQIYSALVFEGPAVIARIVDAIPSR